MTMQYSFRIFILGIFCLTACVPTRGKVLPATAQVFSGELSPYPTRTVTSIHDQSLPDSTLIPTPTLASQKYIVKKDEFGWTIAAKFMITLPQLQVANPDVDLNFLAEGTELIIPPPVATPAPILFTPTPVLLQAEQVRCYPAGDLDMWCLTAVKNPLQENIYFATGEFLVEKSGHISSFQVSALLDSIPASREIPIITYIKERPVYPYHVRFNLQTAVKAEKAPVTQFPVENLQIKIDDNKMSASISGNILTGTDPLKLVSVVASAYGQGLPAGIRKIEFQNPKPDSGKLSFEVIVYTVGPLIDRVEVFSEGK